MIRRKKAKAKTKRKNSPVLLLAAFCLMCSVLLWGISCSKQTEPSKPATAKSADKKLPAGSEKTEAKKQDAATEKAPAVVLADFTYDASGKPDPFEPLVTDLIVSKKSAGDDTSPDESELPPLQKYELTELNLVAIIVGENNARLAMVEDKAGYGYILKRGMLVGKNNGIITDIYEDSVVIAEKITDEEGKEETKTTTLNIYKSESGEP